MGRLVSFFLQRGMLVNVLVLGTALLGASAIIKMNKEAFPPINLGHIFITTIYPGASAHDVEVNITIEIEEELEEVVGIQEVRSTSSEGMSVIQVVADENMGDLEFQRLFDDVDAAVARVEDLPIDIEGRPSLRTVTSDDIPFIQIAFSGSYTELDDFIFKTEDRLRQLPGISAAILVGHPEQEVNILVDPVKARGHFIDLRLIASEIGKRNLEGSGGTLESFVAEKKIVSVNKFEDYRDVLDTNIRMSADGFGVKLRDIAELKLEPEDRKLMVRNNGAPGASIILKKKAGANTYETSDAVHAFMESLELPEGVSYKIHVDSSRIARDRLNLVISNAIIGFVLVMGILFLVFDVRTAFWTAFGIPFSVLFVFIILNAVGLDMNMLTLAGFVIVLGMLVDDAVVIAEQYNSNRESGMEPHAAATSAVATMWKPVLASATTTMTAFTPLLSLAGLPGQFVWVIPFIVVTALLGSLIDSYLFLPVHLAHWERSHSSDKMESNSQSDTSGSRKVHKKAFVHKLESAYRYALWHGLRFRYVILGAFLVLFIGSMMLMRFGMRREAFPQDAAEGFYIDVSLPSGYSLAKTTEATLAIEKIIRQLPENELVGYTTRVGTNSTDTTAERGTLDNIAIVMAYLTPFSERDRTAREIMDVIRDELRPVSSASQFEYTVELQRIGPPLGKEFEIRVVSNDDNLRYNRADEIKSFLSEQAGVLEVDDDRVIGKDEWNLKINHDMLSRTGLSVEDVVQTLRIAFDGMVVTDLVTLDQTLDFRLRLNERARADRDFLKLMPILNRNGQMINLDELVYIQPQPGTGQIHHYNGKRTTTVFGTLDVDVISGEDVVRKVDAQFGSSRDVYLSYAGEPVETQEIFADLLIAAVIALLGIYLIIALIFNSFRMPFVVILAIPFGFIGVIWSVFLHGYPMSMFAGMAMIGLMGVIVNDSIVMVFRILTDRAEIESGDPYASWDYIIDGAVSRLRPILLTTLTTVLGLLPTAYGIGGYDPFLSQMCVALSYGLMFGTLIILYLVPSIYVIGGDIHRVMQKVRAIKSSGNA
ncbi:MAG: efflux RND transporter permease subunit [Leptospiraceae bacterium]|nr:efflux RND transporter permease subunit [Leptospiraceae bacterium]